MKNRYLSLSALLFGTMAILALPGVLPAAEAGAPETAGTADSGYTVRKGDTLWDISRSRLKDPFLWPSIWKQNPSIADPDLIYPGEKLRLPGIAGEPAPSAAAEERLAGPRAETRAEEPFVEKGITVLKTHKGKGEDKVISMDEGVPKKVPVATESDIFRAGFITRGLEGARPIVAGIRNDRTLFMAGDEVYVQDTGGLKVGDRFVSCRPGPDVMVPGTIIDYGRLIYVSGVVELTGKRDDLYVGVVRDSYSDIKKTDLLLPAPEPEIVYEPVPVNEGLNGAWGYVVASKEERATSTDGDTMYIGLGAKDGVKPGDSFAVRRSGGTAPLSDARHYVIPVEYALPDVLAGMVQVVSVRQETSTVKVVSTEEPIRVGYRVYYKH
jgi:hypothetical protein